MTNENFESECNAQVVLLCHNPPYRFYRLFTPSTLLSFSSISQLRSHPSLPSLPTPPLTPKSIKKIPLLKRGITLLTATTFSWLR